MADIAASGFLVVGADLVLPHPADHRRANRIGTVRLDAAVRDRDDAVRPSGEKARLGAAVLLLHRVLYLVAVTVLLCCACDFERFQRAAADAVQRIQHALALQLGFQFIVRMAEITAAAGRKIGTIRLDAVRRGSFHAQELPVRGGLADVHDADKAALAGQRARHKEHLPVDPRNAAPVDRRADDLNVISFVYVHTVLQFVSRETQLGIAFWNVSRETLTPQAARRSRRRMCRFSP